jgi:hypothetical protein
MYLKPKTKCPPTALFDVPHKAEPVTAKYLMKKFPAFANEMDGCGEERCLTYFWQRNKETKVYEFIDEDAEEEVREILGVKLFDEQKEKEKARQKYLQETRGLTEEEIKEFKEELAYVRQQLQHFNNTTKTSSQEQQGPQEVDSESDSDSSHTTP